MPSTAVGTIVAKNYLPFARVLGRSLKEHHPDVPFFALLADEVDDYFDPDSEVFNIVRLDDLKLPSLQQLRFRYPRHHLAIALKPFLLQHLLDSGIERVLFLDADILILGDMTPLLSPPIESSILLTPHLLAPLQGKDRITRELTILRAGTFNAGCVAVSNGEASRRFLSWWQDRLLFHCRHDLGRGMHGDQRWLDLARSFFEEVTVVRDPGCNVAYWNMLERNVEMKGGRLLANGRPARFFHFSGFTPDAPQLVTRHAEDPKMADLGEAAGLFERYAELLLAAGYDEAKSWPYAYGSFDNGVPIPDVARIQYLELGDAAQSFGDPFIAEREGSYYRWLAEDPETTANPEKAISRIWDAVYRQRTDLQRAFPNPRGVHRDAFLAWIQTSGMKEYEMPDQFSSKG